MKPLLLSALSVAVLCTVLATPAHAGPAVVYVDEVIDVSVPRPFHDQTLPPASDAIWHWLVAAKDLSVDMRVGDVDAACDALTASGGGSAVVVKIRWKKQATEFQNVRTIAPKITLDTVKATGSSCDRQRRYAVQPQPRVSSRRENHRFRVVHDVRRQLEESLSDALLRHSLAGGLALGSPEALPPPRVVIPLRLAGDDEYRRRYGAAWVEKAATRVRVANHVLSDAGIRLVVMGESRWETPGQHGDSAKILHSLQAMASTTPGELTIGFSGQTGLEYRAFQEQTLGLAAQGSGYGVLVADAAIFEGDDPTWDAVREGRTLAHELMHNLGIGHADDDGDLMSPTINLTRSIHPEFVERAVTVATSRWARL